MDTIEPDVPEIVDVDPRYHMSRAFVALAVERGTTAYTADGYFLADVE